MGDALILILNLTLSEERDYRLVALDTLDYRDPIHEATQYRVMKKKVTNYFILDGWYEKLYVEIRVM